jgi:hypothetical protein
MIALVRTRRTPLWLALYGLALLSVLSFVFFEVLDVDGSDFERAPSKLAIKVAEESHDELKRGASVHDDSLLALALAPDASDSSPVSATLAHPGLRRVVIRSASLWRAALPRALLSDVPPSA